MKPSALTQAFVLGAGLGTRLRPLTDDRPKPLVPIFQKPLITFAFDHLLPLGIRKFFVNTHHRPECFAEVFPEAKYRGNAIDFRHEVDLLETAGGIANIADSLGGKPLLVYNGDILTDLPLEPLLRQHAASANLVTLALRSGGGPQHIAFDRSSRRIVDIRNHLQTGAPDEFVFTGIYIVEPEFVAGLERVKRSVIPYFLDLIRTGRGLGGVVLDEGHWWDVGNRAAYLQLHRDLPALDFPDYPVGDSGWRAPVHPTAKVDAGAQLRGCSVIGANCQVDGGAVLEDTIVWPGAQIASPSDLRSCIVRSRKRVQGTHRDADL